MAYAPNFLCVRESTIIAVEVDRIVKDVLKTLAEKAEMAPARYGACMPRPAQITSPSKARGSSSRTKKNCMITTSTHIL